MTPTIPVVSAMPAVRRHDRHHLLRVVVALLLVLAAWAALPVGSAQAHNLVTTSQKYCDNVWRYGDTVWGHVSGTLRAVPRSAISNVNDVSVNAKITKHDSNGVMEQWLIYSASGNWALPNVAAPNDPGPVRLGGPYTPRFDYEFDWPGDGQTVWCRLPTHWMPSSQ